MTGVLSASTISGDKVCNLEGEDLGKIEDLVVDLDTGKVAYAVLSFGGFMGMGDKLFALPWQSLTVDKGEHRIILNPRKRWKTLRASIRTTGPTSPTRRSATARTATTGQRPTGARRRLGTRHARTRPTGPV
jgi:sporulation protein YlmC with PRC-barrel domain